MNLSFDLMYKNVNYLKLFSKCNYSSHTGLISKLKVYNTLTKNNENLKFHNPNAFYWYICGPTVYDHAHIGHARYLRNYKCISL